MKPLFVIVRGKGWHPSVPRGGFRRGGNEDQVLGPALYPGVMGVIKRRIGARRAATA